ncbi:MAG TPA: ATP-binding protein [Solirubrobacteraceae bacterium]|nr:ATP-binding protein [Solirubrobacteraceae bacterium]
MTDRRRPHSRFVGLPIRVRLTIAFVGVMAVVLAAIGAFVYAQIKSDLDAQVNNALLSEAQDVEALVQVGRVAAISRSGLGLAQVYDAAGRVVGSSLKVGRSRLLLPGEAVRATKRQQLIDRRTLSFGTVRVIGIPAFAPDGSVRAVAVADRLSLRDDELSDVRSLLLIAGPLALLLVSIAGYELTRAALRPVERMREHAERITERQLAERLPGSGAADEIGALSRTLNAMLDRLEAAVSRERRLVSDASHELRTPLTTLRAELDFALMGEREPEELRAAVKSASEEARRMSHLADDLLVLARADQGRLPLRQQPIAPRELLEAAAARARAGARMSGREIVVGDLSSDGLLVSADPDRIAQTLDNLTTNALRYGGGTIRLSAQPRDGLVELHVSDEGPGFPEEIIVHPFERFARGSEARGREPGSGLGLALVEAVAMAHGGYARARNLPGGGADVWIALPDAQDARSR